MKIFVRHKLTVILVGVTVLLFSFLFFDVLFQGKTLRGEPYAQGVLPSGPVNYQREAGEYTGHTNDPGASAWYNDPIFKLATDQLKEGYIPWWNPFNGMGTPLLASLQSGIMFPPKLAILFLSPTPLMFDIYMIFRILVAFVFTYLFLRSLKISRPISYVSAFAFAFSGSLFRYVNLEHLNIDAFIPMYMFCTEYFLQKQNFRGWLLLVISFTFIILGGFPEASLFAFILINLYFLFRWFSLGRTLSLIKKWVYANIISLFLTAPVVLPFIINMSETWTIHEPSSHVGALYLPFSVLFSLVTPYLFTAKMLELLNLSPYVLLPGWIGGGLLILSAMSIFLIKKEYRIGTFFAVFALLSLLKGFGFPLVNWVGYLPLLNQAIVFKYNNPAMTFAFVVSAAFFLQYLSTKRPSSWHLLGGAGVFTLFYGSFILKFHHVFLDFTINRTIFSVQSTVPKYLFFLVGVTFLGFLVLCLIYLFKRVESKKLREILIMVVLLVVAFETYLNLPKYHPIRDKGYPRVTFLTELQNNAGSDYRVSGRDYVLFPNFSGAYQINDPRTLDAMYLKGFYQFVSTADPNFTDRFINLPNEWLVTPSLLKSTGIKYVLATNSFEEAANMSDLNKDFRMPKGAYTIGQETRSILSIHPPFDMRFKIVFPKDTKGAYFYLAMNPAVWDPNKGDGVCVRVSYSVQEQNVCLDPKSNTGDRIWKKVEIERPKETQEIELRIQVNELNSTTFDWVGMTDLISLEKANVVKENFIPTSNFPMVQDDSLIFSYTVRDPKKIAYFPDKVSFVSKQDFAKKVKENLQEIDSNVFAEGEVDSVSQPNNTTLKINRKINGDITINLPDKHPKFLYVSQAFHSNLHVLNEKNQEVNWYKANIGFILIDTYNIREIRITNAPSQEIKYILLTLVFIGIAIVYWQSRTWQTGTVNS